MGSFLTLANMRSYCPAENEKLSGIESSNASGAACEIPDTISANTEISSNSRCEKF